MWQAMLKEIEAKMQRTLEATTREFSTIRTGRASPALVESVKVNYYGSPTPLIQLATIATPEPRLIVIQPYDANSVKEVEKAILASDLGLTPSLEGKVIRITVPPLSKERREELVKVVHKMAEDGKVALRTIRRDGNEEIKKAEKEKKITEDESFKATEEIQKLTDRYSKRLDDLGASKHKELVTV
jgi:ribosome recycling factor